MGILLLTAIFIVELSKYWILINEFLNVRIKRKWIAVLGLIIYILLSINEETRERDTHLTMYLIVLIMTMLAMEAKVVHKIINTMVGLLITSCADEVFKIPIRYIWNLDKAGALTEDLIFLNSSLFSLLFIVMMIIIKNKTDIFKREKFLKYIKNIIPILILTLFVVLTLTIGALDYARGYVQNDKFILFSNMIIVISFVSIGVLLVFILYIISTNKKMEEMIETERTLKELQLNYYKSMLAREENTRKYRHDMSNHMICLNRLAKEKKSKEVIGYLNDMQNQMAEIRQKVYSVGNEIIDAILNYHLPMIGDEIRIDVIGYCSEELGISNVDLCTIIANLVQNAVEELREESSSEKYLKITIRAGAEFMEFEILNTISDKSRKKNDLLKSEKRDKRNHGLGLSNVKRAIEKNSEKFETEILEKEFIARVILKNT